MNRIAAYGSAVATVLATAVALMTHNWRVGAITASLSLGALACVAFIELRRWSSGRNRSLDPNRILESPSGHEKMASHHFDFYLNQAITDEMLKHNELDVEMRNRLELSALQAFSKAARIPAEAASGLGVQNTPFLASASCANEYHRSAHDNPLLLAVEQAYAADLGVNSGHLHLVGSELVDECIARGTPIGLQGRVVEDVEGFEGFVDQLFDSFKRDRWKERYISFDCSSMVAKLGVSQAEIAARVIAPVREAFVRKLDAFVRANPDIPMGEIRREIVAKMHPVIYLCHCDEVVLLTPPLEVTKYSGGDLCWRTWAVLKGMAFEDVDRGFRYFIVIQKHRYGFVLDPIHAKRAWLKLKSVAAIRREAGLIDVQLAKEGTFPRAYDSLDQMLNCSAVRRFEELEGSNLPYVRALASGTLALIKGLRELDLDDRFARLNLTDFLQISYFRIINAMGEAILRRDDQIAFLNQIQLLHQELQNILVVLQPYGPGALNDAVSSRLHKVVGPSLPAPVVCAKPSSMHCVASIIAGAEQQNPGRELNVVVMKDSYFETGMLIPKSKRHKIQTVRGEDLASSESDWYSIDRENGVDLYLAEMHHNISIDRKVYSAEPLLDQVKLMYNRGVFAERFTVAIDNTIGVEGEESMREFFKDPLISRLILEGKLNVVLYRSAQKFDMFGMDNYYGGILSVINSGAAFAMFNARMADERDQLTGPAYQGLVHYQRHAGEEIQGYRKAITDNVTQLYRLLPSELIHVEGSRSPVQIAAREDETLPFLDIQTPNSRLLGDALYSALRRFAEAEGLPLMSRSSYGFSTTNMVHIGDCNFRLTIGLDSKETLERYAAFFRAVQSAIERSWTGSTVGLIASLGTLRVPPPARTV